MKSKDVKNWRYELSYDQTVKLDDFLELLTEAISNDRCLRCGGGRILNDGLCLDCARNLTDAEKVADDEVLRTYEVKILVEKRTD